LTPGLFLDEERSQPILQQFKDKENVLANQFVLFRYLAGYGADRTASAHFEFFLQVNECTIELLDVLPIRYLQIDEISGITEDLDMTFQDLVDKSCLTFKIMIKLAFTGRGRFNDPVRAGGSHTLLVKQFAGHANNAKPGGSTVHRSRSHKNLAYLQNTKQYSFPGTQTVPSSPGFTKLRLILITAAMS